MSFRDRIGIDLARRVPVEEGISIVVNVRSYNGGPEKVALTKRGFKADGTPWEKANIGRLTAEVAVQLGELLYAEQLPMICGAGGVA